MNALKDNEILVTISTMVREDDHSAIITGDVATGNEMRKKSAHQLEVIIINSLLSFAVRYAASAGIMLDDLLRRVAEYASRAYGDEEEKGNE